MQMTAPTKQDQFGHQYPIATHFRLNCLDESAPFQERWLEWLIARAPGQVVQSRLEIVRAHQTVALRTAQRNRVLKAGLIEFPGGAFSCMVRNMSKGGAALDVPSQAGIPNEFSLRLPIG